MPNSYQNYLISHRHTFIHNSYEGSLVMRSRILAFATILLCSWVASFAQSTQTVEESKLIAAPPVPSEQRSQFEQTIKDVHFDFDRADLTAEDRRILASNADWLKAHPGVLVTVEGDADDRGDIVYNLVLSGNRAIVTKNALIELGVPADQIAFATGWGKLYPVCQQSDESCWSQNRRAHFSTWPPAEESKGATVARSTTSSITEIP